MVLFKSRFISAAIYPGERRLILLITIGAHEYTTTVSTSAPATLGAGKWGW